MPNESGPLILTIPIPALLTAVEIAAIVAPSFIDNPSLFSLATPVSRQNIEKRAAALICSSHFFINGYVQVLQPLFYKVLHLRYVLIPPDQPAAPNG